GPTIPQPAVDGRTGERPYRSAPDKGKNPNVEIQSSLRPKYRSTDATPRKQTTVIAQLAKRAVAKLQPWRSIQGRIRNIGRVGRTNQKVPSAWFAMRSGSPGRSTCIQTIAMSEVMGSAITRAESRSLTCWVLVTSTITAAETTSFTTSIAVTRNTCSQGILLMASSCGRPETDGQNAPCNLFDSSRLSASCSPPASLPG